MTSSKHLHMFAAALLWCFAAPSLAQTTTDAAAAKTVTSLVTAALASDPQLDVMSSEDVRRVVALEADKQSMGCSESSCLAEVAGAMGANVVVFGDLGHLGRVYIVTLSTFDSKEGRATGRAVVKADSIEQLADKIEPAVKQLMASFPRVAEGPTRVIVLDVATSGAGTADPVAAAPPPVDEQPRTPWLLMGGGATAGLGALVLGAGAAVGTFAVARDLEAGDKAETTQVYAIELYAQRDVAAFAADVLFLAGGVLVVGGAAVVGLHFLGSE